MESVIDRLSRARARSSQTHNIWINESGEVKILNLKTSGPTGWTLLGDTSAFRVSETKLRDAYTMSTIGIPGAPPFFAFREGKDVPGLSRADVRKGMDEQITAWHRAAAEEMFRNLN